MTLLKKGIKIKKFNFLSRQGLYLDGQKLNFFQWILKIKWHHAVKQVDYER